MPLIANPFELTANQGATMTVTRSSGLTPGRFHAAFAFA
jgi:hypothetical protein